MIDISQQKFKPSGAPLKNAKFSMPFALITFFWAFDVSAEKTPQDVFKLASKSVVRVFAEQPDNTTNSGSGVFVTPKLIATNCHVLGGQKNPSVKYKEKILNAKGVYSSTERDLCLIEIMSGVGFPAKLLESKNITQGMRVFAIGSPKGFELTISEGLVSGIRESRDYKYIQTSAAISSGSSGGGLFSSDGRLIGLTSFTLREGQNINFALPVDWIQDALSIIEQSKEFSHLQLPIGQPKEYIAGPKFAKEWAESVLPIVTRRKICAFTTNPAGIMEREFLQTVWFESSRLNINPYSLLALISILSECRRHYISNNGQRGYMALSPELASRMGAPSPSILFDPQVNIRVGALIIKALLNEHKSEEDAITGYFKISKGIDAESAPRVLARKTIELGKSISEQIK